MTNKPGINYLPDVEFCAHISEQNNCVCSGCRKTGTVLKLTVPETKYNDGKPVSLYQRILRCCTPVGGASV